jgi:hypothetical protein
MALIKLSGLLSGLKGKINGSYSQSGGNGLFKLNNNGQYSAKKKPKRMINADARVIQLTYAQQTQAWKTLSDTDRTAWASACVNYPTVDRFGNPRIPSAYELYMRLNGTLVRYGISPISAPLAPAVMSTIGPLSIEQTAADQFKFTPNGSFSADEILILCGGNWQSAGKTFNITTQRVLTQYDNAVTWPQDPYNDYSAIFGQPAGNSRLYFSMYLINKSTGQKGIEQVGYMDYTL